MQYRLSLLSAIIAAGIAAAPSLAAITITEEMDEGQMSYKIETDNAVYYYQKEGAAFSSIVDKNGNDWIGYHPTGGNNYESNSRGLPNLMYNRDGLWANDFFHPGKTGADGSTTTIETQETDLVVLKSVSADNLWEVVWEFRSFYAKMTLNKAAHQYWWLYEGTPGGSFSASEDYYVLSDGTRADCGSSFANDMPNPEWIYFGDKSMQRVLFLAHHTDDSHADQYWNGSNAMTVFGFGRQSLCCGHYLTEVPNTWSIGILEDSTFAGISATITAVVAGAVDVQPQINMSAAAGNHPSPLQIAVAGLNMKKAMRGPAYSITGRLVSAGKVQCGEKAGSASVLIFQTNQ
jgi:hypothetical protein